MQLLDSPFRHAQELNLVTLMKYDPDRFLAPFRKVAGLEQKAENYPNWESGGLDGHVGGHNFPNAPGTTERLTGS